MYAGTEPAPVRYDTQKYLQGGRVAYRGAGLVDHGPRVGKLTTTVPPKRGPNYQGLNVKYKKVKTISEKINGGNRQVLTQRSKNKYKTT